MSPPYGPKPTRRAAIGHHSKGQPLTNAPDDVTNVRMPSVYIPHGGGPAFFMEGPMRDLFQPMADYLATIGASLPTKPSSILVITAHWEESVVALTGGEEPHLIYDYGGFPPETYELTYSAPGHPDLADRAASLLAEAGIGHRVDPNHGWDHGVFIPLKVMFPDADIPVVALSLTAGLEPGAHVRVGEALAPLRDDGVLLVGSGMSYHNLSRMTDGAEASISFDDWLGQALDGDRQHRSTNLEAWASAPAGRAAHPREEHLLPLMVVSGAGSDAPARKTWQGAVGASRVSAWAFD